MSEQKKKMGKGVKIVLFLVVCVVWLAMAYGLQKLSPGFHEGGWGMWPILLVGIVSLMIIVERVRYLFFVAPLDQKTFQAQVHRYLLAGDVAGAVQYCQSMNKPLANIVGAGLSNLHRPDAEVQEAVDERALDELPRIEVRTGYLAMIGNIATLLGLLGTILGLMTAFSAVAAATATERQEALAAGISQAMYTTAFGILVAVILLVCHHILTRRAETIILAVEGGASATVVALAAAAAEE